MLQVYPDFQNQKLLRKILQLRQMKTNKETELVEQKMRHWQPWIFFISTYRKTAITTKYRTPTRKKTSKKHTFPHEARRRWELDVFHTANIIWLKRILKYIHVAYTKKGKEDVTGAMSNLYLPSSLQSKADGIAQCHWLKLFCLSMCREG